MPGRINTLFLLLIFAHGIHATEEFFGKLWNVYRPAIFICNLISRNPETGFLAINTAFILISLLFWKLVLSKGYEVIPSLLWIWILLQLLNVTGHFAWTLISQAYTPGVISALLILILVILLISEVKKFSSPGRSV